MDVLSVKISPYQSRDEWGRIQYGTEVRVAFDRGRGTEHSLSRLNYQVTDTPGTRTHQTETLLKRAEKWL